jgi:hypothetical protein
MSPSSQNMLSAEQVVVSYFSVKMVPIISANFQFG